MNPNELTPQQQAALQNHVQETGGEPRPDNSVIEPPAPPVQNPSFGGTIDTTKLAAADPTIIQHNNHEYGPEAVLDAGGHNIGLDNKIADLQKEMGMSFDEPANVTVKTYQNDAGDETYYVKNISNGHVILTDGREEDGGINLKVPKGDVVDLLESAALDRVKASRDVRKCLGGKNPLLKRITPKQYFMELENMRDMQKKIAILRRQEAIKAAQVQQNPQNNEMNLPHNLNVIPPDVDEPILRRGMLESRLEKLRLAKDTNPENQVYGISDLEFIEWVAKESLTPAECDFLASDPIMHSKHDVKSALYTKKGNVVG